MTWELRRRLIATLLIAQGVPRDMSTALSMVLLPIAAVEAQNVKEQNQITHNFPSQGLKMQTPKKTQYVYFF